MTSEMLFVLCVAAAALVAFVVEWWAADATALVVVLVLVAGGVVSEREAFEAFGNEALVTVAAMFVLSAALTRTGAVERVGRLIVRWGGRSEPRILLALMVACAGCSAFINNTPIAVVFLPIVLGIARRTSIPASKFLLPMSYATIVGGMCTVIGTSTNVLVSARLPALGLGPLPLFEPLPLALAGMALTVLYMLTLGRRLLPANETLAGMAPAGGHATYVTELSVPAGSRLVGRTVAEALGREAATVRVLQVIRDEAIHRPGEPGLRLAAGDALIARGSVDALLALHRDPSVDVGEAGADALVARGRDTSIAELLVRPTSGAIGARVGDLGLRARHDVVVLAVQREGAHLRTKVVDLRLRLGDVLLVQGDARGLDSLRASPDFLVLEGVAEQVVLREKAWLAVGIVGAVVALAAAGVLKISLLALAGSLAMVAAGCLSAREAYRALDLPLLVLMAGTITLGRGLEASGAAGHLAGALVGAASPFGDVAVLAAVYLVGNVLTALISNAAAALITLPIALAVAAQTGMQPLPFVLAVMFSASIDFSTPIGYQTNTFVYGPGGYRFLDYVRVGGPLNLLWWGLSTLLIPLLWPLR